MPAGRGRQGAVPGRSAWWGLLGADPAGAGTKESPPPPAKRPAVRFRKHRPPRRPEPPEDGARPGAGASGAKLKVPERPGFRGVHRSRVLGGSPLIPPRPGKHGASGVPPVPGSPTGPPTRSPGSAAGVWEDACQPGAPGHAQLRPRRPRSVPGRFTSVLRHSAYSTTESPVPSTRGPSGDLPGGDSKVNFKRDFIVFDLSGWGFFFSSFHSAFCF